MKRNNTRNGKPGRKKDSGQMILLAAFLVAVTVLGMGVVFGSTFYSQSSPSDSGLSSLTAQVSDQIETAEDVGLQNIVEGNENATQTDGRNETQVCQDLLNLTEREVRQQVELSENEIILNVTLLGDCDDFDKGNRSYTIGQQNSSRLPGVSVSNPINKEENISCDELKCQNYTDFKNHTAEFNQEVANVVKGKDSSDGNYSDDYEIPANYSEGNGLYNYTDDKITAMQNVGDIDLTALPGNITNKDFARCVGVEVNVDDGYNCTELRGLTNLSDASVNTAFQNELLDVVRNETPGSDVPSDYNESDPSAGNYSYGAHKTKALNNTANTTSLNLSALPDGIDTNDFAGCVDASVDDEVYNCSELMGSSWVDLNGTAFVEELTNVVQNRSSSPYPNSSIVPLNPKYNETDNPDAYNYTEDKVAALNNMPSVNLSSDLPSVVNSTEFASCFNVSLGARNFTCGQIRNESGYNDHVDQFKDALKDVVEDKLGDVPTDYNESDNNNYDYEQHKIWAFDNASDIDPSNISDGITQLAEFDSKAEALANCVEVQQLGRLPADVVFTIDTTGSMGFDDSSYDHKPENMPNRSEDYRPEASDSYPSYSDTMDPIWQPQGERVGSPWSVGCANEYNETGVSYDDDWCAGGNYIVYDWHGAPSEINVPEWDTSTGSVGDYVVDLTGPRIVKVDDIIPATNEARVVDSGGPPPDIVHEDDLSRIGYVWWRPERLYFTQKGARGALGDLKDGEDRAGLVRYDTTQSGNAEQVQGLGDITSSYRDTLKQEIDQFREGGGTDITAGIQEARSTLDMSVCEGTASRTANCHIVLMSDGAHNKGYPQPDDYVNSIAESDYEDIYIHTISLGDGGDDSTMKAIANNGSSYSNVRPEGVFVSSDDPSDAEGLFKDIVDQIQNTGNGSANTNGTDDSFQVDLNGTLGQQSINFDETNGLNTSTNSTLSFNQSRDVNSSENDIDFNETITASGGIIEKIYELNMNVTKFEGEGTYSVGLVDADNGTGNQNIVWEMEVDNSPTDANGTPLTFPPSSSQTGEIETQINLVSDVNSSLNKELNSSANLSKFDTYVWMDAIEREFEVQNSSATPLEYEMEGYMEDVREVVEKEAKGLGVTGKGLALQTGDTGPGGANGTFAFDFRPVNGNFTKVAQSNITFGSSSAQNVCDQGPNDIVTCGTEDSNNTAKAYASAQIKTAKFRVEIEGPGGVSERIVEIKLEGAQ